MKKIKYFAQNSFKIYETIRFIINYQLQSIFTIV